MSIAKIRQRLEGLHPVISVQVDDELTPYTADERAKLLDEWAQQLYDAANEKLRRERNRLLAESDWTQQPDAPVDSKAWAAYRQELRDLPANTEDPENPVWPALPQ